MYYSLAAFTLCFQLSFKCLYGVKSFSPAQKTLLPPNVPTESATSDAFNKLFEDNFLEIDKQKMEFSAPLPPWLKGTLVRNGAGVFGSTQRRYTHLFDGLSKLSSFTISPSPETSHFSAKFLRSDWYRHIVTEKKDLPWAIGAGVMKPPLPMWKRFFGIFDKSFDNTGVNVHQLGGVKGPWVAITDAPVMNAIEPLSLTTIGKTEYANKLSPSGGTEFFSSAHPKSSLNGDDISYNIFAEINPLGTNTLHVAAINEKLERSIIGSIKLEKGELPYVHDFSITSKYAILCLYPLNWDLNQVLNENGMFDAMKWNASAPTKIYVFDLARAADKSEEDKTQYVAYFEAPASFGYHHVNAYEESVDGKPEIVLDMVAHNHPDIIKGKHAFGFLDNLIQPEARKELTLEGNVLRYRLPLGSSKTDGPVKTAPSITNIIQNPAVNCDLRMEYPTINPTYYGRRHRYAYGVASRAGEGQYLGSYLDWAIVKQDMLRAVENCDKGSSLSTALWWKEANCFPSEAVFVPSPKVSTEDDGVLLSQVYDANREESFLLVLDAANMKEISRAYLGCVCSYSFHGLFIPSEK